MTHGHEAAGLPLRTRGAIAVGYALGRNVPVDGIEQLKPRRRDKMERQVFIMQAQDKFQAALDKHFGVEGEAEAAELMVTLELENVWIELADMAEALDQPGADPSERISVDAHFGGYYPQEDKPLTLKLTCVDSRENRHLLADLDYGRVEVRSLSVAEIQRNARERAERDAVAAEHPGQLTIPEGGFAETVDRRLGTKFEHDKRMNLNGVFVDGICEWVPKLGRGSEVGLTILTVAVDETDHRFGLCIVADPKNPLEMPLDIESEIYASEGEALANACAEIRRWLVYDSGLSEKEVAKTIKALDKWAKEENIFYIPLEAEGEAETEDEEAAVV